MAWALALLLLIYWLYPQPITVLHLDLGADREQALIYGSGRPASAARRWPSASRGSGTGGFRLPTPGAYPGAIINAVGTAFIDEALFRGVILGLLLHWGWPPALAIAFETILYGLATRLWRPRAQPRDAVHRPGRRVPSAAGWWSRRWASVRRSLAHAITRFAVFLATGHSDQARPVGWEPEEVAGRALPPKGWDLADGTGSQAWMAPPSGPPGLGPSYAGQSPFAPPGYGAAQGYPDHGGWAPPPGMSSAPISGPGPYQEQQWVVDPATGGWIPAQPPPMWDVPPDGWPPPPEGFPAPPEGWTAPPDGWPQPPSEPDGQPHA